jgi:1-acyl-sn-glycerol-3-phosphate acyltransferase
MNPVYYCGWRFFRTAYKLYCRAEWFNAERVPKTGRSFLPSNHASIIDPPLVGTGLERGISYLARESLFRFPGVGWVLRNWDAVPVDRDGGGAKGLKIILDRLLGGAGIILFPEGTRTMDGKLQPARSGIGLTVIKSTAPVVPVRVFGTFEAYGKDAKFPKPYKIMPPSTASRCISTEVAGGSEDVFQAAAEGDLSGGGRRDHGADCQAGAV